jgi:hypothetical protein|nr:MAG TPA: hypothetical protein [Caudoviricetes sp.]DAT17953.1 MAG TPA: hypothetical protein [Caudoviricetes sp.]
MIGKEQNGFRKFYKNHYIEHKKKDKKKALAVKGLN